MKKLFLLLIGFTIAIVASAEPANPTPITVTQPSGETLKMRLVGDEFYHFNTTIDGYTILKVDGCWEYAMKKGERLVSTGVIAHDPEARTAQELQLLESTPKYLVDKQETNHAHKARLDRDTKNQSNEPVVDYSTFRGLIILINYNDKQFQMSNANSFYNQLCNTHNYTGFYHQGQFQQCTGSVRDYYYDNSMGQFDPDFDVVGPVTLDYSCYEGHEKSREIFQAALDAVDGQVDFSQYDADNDGEIDMVFFIVAGYSSSYSGNNSGYLWPHMSYLYGYNGSSYYYLQYDSKYMGRYASSCEIYGWESYGYTMPIAIGTICHEFGHVLGLPDLYDTDYDQSGGQSLHPDGWDVMAGGSHNNYGRTPVGYSLWERWELGFTSKPQELTAGAKTLSPVNTSNTGFMMSSPNPQEYFLFEDRQPNKWDSALPGHGLLVTRVDRSNQSIWDQNDVNCNPQRNYYELIRASGTNDSQVPFPGTSNVTELNSITEPALVTWDGQSCNFGLSGITETGGNITFNVVAEVEPSTIVEDFEAMPVSTVENPADVLGNFATWTFPKASVVTASGGKAAGLQSPGGIYMTSDINVKMVKLTMQATNQSTTASKLQLQYSLDEGVTWTTVSTENVSASSSEQLQWLLNDINQPVRFKIMQTSGSKNKLLLIDDITITYTEAPTYDLKIADTQVDGATIGNLAQIDGVEGLVQYLPVSNIIKIGNATITGEGCVNAGATLSGLNIQVQGEGTLNTTRVGRPAIIFHNSDDAIVQGVSSGDDYAKLNINVPAGNNTTPVIYYISFYGNDEHRAFIKDIDIHMTGTAYIGSENWDECLTVENSNIIADGPWSDFYVINDVQLVDCYVALPEGGYFDRGQLHDAEGNEHHGPFQILRSQVVAGDVNGDGSVTSADVTALYNYLLNGDNSNIVNGDQNNDGNITSSDITWVYNILLGS
ncbi:MAG: M6 family metalloprotease domain-containing protein [Muribaculaceae bacterium]|nr:M6 family metalloprotease domain-containing protein [Muribaculaceae bacterium]